MDRLETFCPLWPKLDWTSWEQLEPVRVYGPLRGKRPPRRAAQERNSIGSSFLLHRRLRRGARWDWTRQSGQSSFGWKMGRFCKEWAGRWVKPYLTTAGSTGSLGESERDEGEKQRPCRQSVHSSPSTEAPCSATLNLLFQASRHQAQAQHQ